MYVDYCNRFSADQAVTATAASANVVDLNAIGMADGEPIRIHCEVTADFATLTSLEVQVQTDSADTFGSPVTLQKASLALADLVAGAVFPLGILTGAVEQYVRLNYAVTGSDATAGTIYASLVNVSQTNT